MAWWRRSMVSAGLVAMLAVACGGDGATDTQTQAPATEGAAPAATDTATEGTEPATDATEPATEETEPATDGTEAAGGCEPPSETTSLTVAPAATGLAYLQLHVADDQGFYADRNLDVETIEVGGSAAATAAVESGQADLMVTLPEGVITARAQGSTLKMVGATVNENLYELYVGEGVSSLDDLAGTQVGMLVEGNGTDIQVRWLLDQHGAGADQSTFVAVGGLADRLAAIQNNQVSAALLFPPFDVQAERSGLESIADMSEYVDGYPHEVISATEATLAEQAAAVCGYLAAIVEAAEFIDENPEEAIDIATEVTGGERDLIAESFEAMSDTYALDGSIQMEGLEWTIDVMEEYGTVQGLPSADEVYDPSFLPSR